MGQQQDAMIFDPQFLFFALLAGILIAAGVLFVVSAFINDKDD